MASAKINPEKVTKPFQLLATWLAGLILLVSSLLIASTGTYEAKWLNVFYAISSVAIIPIFLCLIFLLTKPKKTLYPISGLNDKLKSLLEEKKD